MEAKYIFGLFAELRVPAVQRVPEAAGQLPQWLILRLPIHVEAVRSRLVAATVRAKVSVAQGAPPRMWERAPLADAPDRGTNLQRKTLIQ